jgi:hypothetical protein
VTYLFSGTSDDMMSAVLRDLEGAGEPGPAQSAHFRQAMAELVGLYDRQAEDGPADPSLGERFRRESGDALLALGDAVRGYVSITALHAETPDEDELYDLALRRSAIQSLLDDYAGTPVADLVDRDELAELDADLRRAAADLGPIPAESVPRGIPPSHWWWRYPDAT